MSTSQQQRSFMSLLAGMPKPDVEQAILMLDHAKDIGLPPRMIAGVETFIDRQKHSATLDARAKEAKDASSGAWGTVREMAKRTDDLVDMVEDMDYPGEPDSPSDDTIQRAAAFLAENAPLAAGWYNKESDHETFPPIVPITSNDEQAVTLLVLFQAAVQLIKHDFARVYADEINILLDEWMQRCSDKVALAQQTLVQASKTCGLSPRQIIKEISPFTLDILEGAVAIEGIETDELVFAHRCWALWDDKLSTAEQGSAIASEIKGRPASSASEQASTGKGGETRTPEEPKGTQPRGLDRAREQGRQAFINGVANEKNPYEARNYKEAWAAGWVEASSEAVPAGVKA